MEDYCCLRARLHLLGFDLSGHRHRGRTHSSSSDVCRALLGRGHGDAGLLCVHWTPHSFFVTPALPFSAVGILLLMGGNLTLSYAERIVPTGLAALLVAV